MNRSQFAGLGVALVTPFNRDGTLDLPAMGRLVKHVSAHADYLVVSGSTGESATISLEEKMEVLKFVIKQNQGKLPIVYGHGGNNTRQLLKDMDRIDWKGVDAILSVSPAYNKPSSRGIIQHFTAIADKAPRPVILYNVPGRTGSNITSSTTLTLAEHKNIIGIKEASGNMDQNMAIAANKPDDFLLISGDDMLTLPMMSIGAVGLISVLGNAYGKEFSRMIRSFDSGNTSEACAILYKFLELNPLMYEEGNPCGIKEVLRNLGICENTVRLPLAEVSESLSGRIRQAMP